MSVQSALKSLWNAGVLFPYKVPNTRHPSKRRLFLTKAANTARLDSDSATNILCNRGTIEAALARWVSSGQIYGDRKRRFITDLLPPPPEIWEIRVLDGQPKQARLLGRFPEPDTLILTSFRTRDLLGDRGSQGWDEAMNDCVAQWEALSPALPLFSANSIREYVTENCDDFPIKIYDSGLSSSSTTRLGRFRHRSFP